MKSKIHRCNCRKVWSIQNRKFKITVHSILLTGEWFAELKPERKCEPKGFVTTKKSQEIVYNPTSKNLENFTIVDKLIYDKKNVNFNIKNGKCLYFAEDGTCYILNKET
ncbi:hypothetical protein ABLO26_28465 [Neobacillus sp. 179-J 1A1 HS]|uniref:hypothetical protein n=1 Tax=Neobacillus driksii TaxID=3035913 RepID=UPI0035BBE5A0